MSLKKVLSLAGVLSVAACCLLLAAAGALADNLQYSVGGLPFSISSSSSSATYPYANQVNGAASAYVTAASPYVTAAPPYVPGAPAYVTATRSYVTAVPLFTQAWVSTPAAAANGGFPNPPWTSVRAGRAGTSAPAGRAGTSAPAGRAGTSAPAGQAGMATAITPAAPAKQ